MLRIQRHLLPFGIISFVAMLVVATPLCGVLFDCGCTWPWAGLEKHCNIHDAKALHQCPWCVSTLAGGVSLGSAILLGFAANVLSMNKTERMIFSTNKTWFIQVKSVLKGWFVFLMVAFIAGYISAQMQQYPYFILDRLG